jgi:hypothetical protein
LVAGSLLFETGSHKKSPGFDRCLNRAHPVSENDRTVGCLRLVVGSLLFETGSHKKSPGFDCCLDRAHPVSENDRTVGCLRLVVGSLLSIPAFTFSERGCSQTVGCLRLVAGSLLSIPAFTFSERGCSRTVGCLRLVAGSLVSKMGPGHVIGFLRNYSGGDFRWLDVFFWDGRVLEKSCAVINYFLITAHDFSSTPHFQKNTPSQRKSPPE